MVHPVIARLGDSDPRVRREACRDAVEDPSATLLIDALARALGDHDVRVGRAASDALCALAPRDPAVVPAVRAALRGDDPSARWMAARTAARVEPPSARLVAPAVEALGAAAGDVRWEAARLLVDTGRAIGEVRPLVIGLVREGATPAVRRMAVHCASELAPESPETASALLAATRDPDAAVRLAALTALSSLHEPDAAVIRRLFEAGADESQPAGRPLALLALARLAQDHPALVGPLLPGVARQHLAELADDAPPPVRNAAQRVLDALA